VNVQEPNAQRGRLSRALILETAIGIADREGIDAVSMRRIGSELGVQAMSLYHHVRNKQDLISGMASHLLATLAIDEDAHATWQDLVRDTARNYRQLGLRHPAIFPLILSLSSDAVSMGALETVLRAIRRAGFSARATLLAYSLLTNFVEGYTLDELNRAPTASSRPLGAAGTTDAFPTVREVLDPALASADDVFEACLDLIVEALDRLRAMT